MNQSDLSSSSAQPLACAALDTALLSLVAELGYSPIIDIEGVATQPPPAPQWGVVSPSKLCGVTPYLGGYRVASKLYISLYITTLAETIEQQLTTAEQLYADSIALRSSIEQLENVVEVSSFSLSPAEVIASPGHDMRVAIELSILSNYCIYTGVD